MSNVIPIGMSHRIAGTWKYCDGFTDTEYSFEVVDGTVAVQVCDTSDGEMPEIYDIQWSERELMLRFAAHWSTGRLVKYSIAVGPNTDRIEATVTSTWQELWERQ